MGRRPADGGGAHVSDLGFHGPWGFWPASRGPLPLGWRWDRGCSEQGCELLPGAGLKLPSAWWSPAPRSHTQPARLLSFLFRLQSQCLKKYLFMYFAALGLSCGMRDLLSSL